MNIIAKTSRGGGKTLSYLLAGVFALATTGAWAEDWTVSENTMLTEDKTVDALTVNEGATLNLNGYKLTCTSLDGKGTITSPDGDTDLTSPDTTEPYHVTWLIKADTEDATSPEFLYSSTTPRNLFDDDDSTRVLMQKGSNNANMPLAVIYDFGDGKQKTVNKYSIRGPGSNFARGPKAWTFEGSDNGTTWNELHSKDNESWTSATSKEYQFSNSTAYRYYRIKFMESADISTSYGGPFLELNELRFYNTNASELHVNVAAGETATVESLTISGNVKVVKDGAGTLNGITNIGSDKFPGELEVNAGTVYVAVKNDRFNIGNASGGNGTLTVNGGTVEVDSSSTTAVGFSSGKTGTVNLNGGILKTTRLVNVYGTGIVNFNGGTLQANGVHDYGLFGNNVTVAVNERGGTIDGGKFSIKVPAAIDGTGAMRFKGSNTITLTGANSYTGGTTIELGTKVVTSNEAAKDTILGNLAIDGKSQLTDAEGIEVFQYSSALAEGDLANVSLKNCDENSTKYIDGNCIKVNFVAPAWVLDADTTWSALVATYGAPAAGATVRIAASGVYTLTIDQDVTVGQLVFTDNNPNVVVSYGCTNTADTITFAAANTDYSVHNDGVVVLNGTGDTYLNFNNASRGVYRVNHGTLKVSGVTTGGGTPGLVPEGREPNRENQFVYVASGATYDLNGFANNTASVRLEKGATLANSGDDINTMQIPQLILVGDATVKIDHSFGLGSSLVLGNHTLTIKGSKTFWISTTTISGEGTIVVDSGSLCVDRNKTPFGEKCELNIKVDGKLELLNGSRLTVMNFTNEGDASGGGTGWLKVTGTLTPGNPLKRLTLADGATVKASATKAQIVNNEFSASGTITIDASSISKAQLNEATDQRIAVLTVPTKDKSGDWNVDNPRVVGCRYKWVDNGNYTSTLYIVKPGGFLMIIR